MSGLPGTGEWIWEWRAAPGGGRLKLWAPAAAPQWIETGWAYWCDPPRDRETVRSHNWGGRVERVCLGPAGASCYIKRFSPVHLCHLYKVRRARHTVLHESRIRQLGFHVPETVCLIERYRYGIAVESLVISLEVSGIYKVSTLINEEAGDAPETWAAKRNLLRQVAGEVGRWHNAGLFHGDLHAGNLVCRPETDPPWFCWIDNEEGRHYRRLPLARRVHDLNHLNRQRHRLSRTDRLRWWESYLEVTGLSQEEQRRLHRAVARKTRAFWRKKEWMYNDK